MNWFEAKGIFFCGKVKAINEKAKLILRKSCGFRAFKDIEKSLYHAMGIFQNLKKTTDLCEWAYIDIHCK